MTNYSVACIYCGSTSPSSSLAHIVPESLGGKDSPFVDRGVVCDKCNQYFGQKVEAKALASFPFLTYRAFAGVPSKKGKEVFAPSTIGNVASAGISGRVVVMPWTELIAKKLKHGEITQFRVLAEVSQPLAVCQMLLKIGIELLAKHHYDVAVSERIATARDFARRPKRGATWWAVLRCTPQELLNRISVENEVEIRESQGALFFVMRLPGVEAIIPLEQVELMNDLSEPEYITVRAAC